MTTPQRPHTAGRPPRPAGPRRQPSTADMAEQAAKLLARVAEQTRQHPPVGKERRRINNAIQTALQHLADIRRRQQAGQTKN